MTSRPAWCGRMAMAKVVEMPRIGLLLSLLFVGCVGTAPVPMVQVPLLRRAGQIEGGLGVAPTSEEPSLGAIVRAAPTDAMRVGASVSAATRQAPAQIAERRRVPEGTPRLFADGFFGGEWGGLFIRYGLLAGAGYGLGRGAIRDCPGACPSSAGVRMRNREFVRSYGQMHIALAPPGPLMTSFAVRVPVVVDLPDAGLSRRTTIDTEFALTQSAQLRYVRVDVQPQWSTLRGFALHLAILFRGAVQRAPSRRPMREAPSSADRF